MAVYTWTMCPATLVETSQRRAIQAPAELNQSRGRQINERELRRWVLTYDSLAGILTEVERAWIITGGILAISYTPPGGSAVDVRFAEDTLERVRRNAAAGSVTVILEEIR